MAIVRSTDRLAKSLGDIFPEALLNFAMRISMFMVFWSSVQTKLGGSQILGQKWMFWEISASTFLLFEYDYNLPVVPANIATYLATFAEFFFSIFILLGLLTRVSALALLIITLVIQIFVYPGAWATHLLWAVALLYLLKNGGGPFSIDGLLNNR